MVARYHIFLRRRVGIRHDGVTRMHSCTLRIAGIRYYDDDALKALFYCRASGVLVLSSSRLCFAISFSNMDFAYSQQEKTPLIHQLSIYSDQVVKE